jgi:hypothetical protein
MSLADVQSGGAIADCRLPIADFKKSDDAAAPRSEIGNWK